MLLVNYISENRARFTWSTLAYRICRWFWAQAQTKIGLSLGLDVYCDRSNLTFIEMLNTEAKRQELHWLKFYSVPQIEILFRISFKQGLIGANKLHYFQYPITDNLLQELATAAWDTKSVKPKLLRDVRDHAMDAFDYAMVPWYHYFIKSINPYWLRRYGVSLGRYRVHT